MNKQLLNELDNMMKQLSSDLLPLKSYCAKNNLHLFTTFLPLDTSGLLIEKLDNNKLEKLDIVSIYKESVKEEIVIHILNDWCDKIWAFNKRKSIVIDAVHAHFDSKYTLSIPVFFILIEGILREFGNVNIKEKFRQSTIPRGDEWIKRGLDFYDDDAKKYFRSFIAKLFECGKPPNCYTRHTVLHGLNNNYHSEENSLVLLLTLFEIRLFMFFLKEIPPCFSESI